MEEYYEYKMTKTLSITLFTILFLADIGLSEMLKKSKIKQSDIIQNKIIEIQQNLKKQFNYIEKVEAWEKEKARKIISFH